jgi:DNA-binding NtrC family response regulator
MARVNAHPARILVVDDEPASRMAVAAMLRRDGYVVETAADAFKALPKLGRFAPDVVFSDLLMPGMDGIDLTRRALEGDSDRAVIIISAYATGDAALAAFRAGAADFLTKPIEIVQLREVLERALARWRARGASRPVESQPQGLPNLIGTGAAMLRLTDLVHRAAPSDASVMLTGESGTGKELVAEALHALSPRACGPFVRLHCAALAENLLESELFGHERGAFTGATSRRDGRFLQAHRGTIFLDEIGEISPALQVKLLRVLQERELERVGGRETIAVDVRIVAATHRDLPALVAAGRFREDLYYRLHVVPIRLPPLRDRLEDVPALAQHFLSKYAAQNGRPVTGFTDEALAALCSHRWPGNVRELENAVERAVVIVRGDVIDVAELALTVVQQKPTPPPIPGSTMEELERDAIVRAIEHAHGSTTRAASLLGVSARLIQYRLHEWGIPLPGRRRRPD